MKKVIVLLIGLFVLALAVPAMAGDDFDLDVDIEKEKFVGIDIDKWVDVKVDVKSNAKEAAEAEAVMNQENDQNVAIEALGLSMGVMGNSVNANEGITGVNQATGNLNNQGNVAAVAVTLDGEEEELPPPPPGPCVASACGDDNRGGGHHYKSGEPFVDAEAFVVQENDENELYKIVTGSAAAMGTSVNDNTGIVGVNQASGSLNNQANAVAIAAGLDGVDVALAESALGQTNTGSGNFLVQVGYEATGFICGSISGNSGVVGVNQAAGNMNNQANVVSISAGPAF